MCGSFLSSIFGRDRSSPVPPTPAPPTAPPAPQQIQRVPVEPPATPTPAPQADETKSYLKESVVNKMSSQEYEKNVDNIMEAIRSGKFIYDISGSAR